MVPNDVRCLNMLKSAREKMNWDVEEQRKILLCQMYYLVMHWEGVHPDLTRIFLTHEIEWLLIQDIFSETGTKIIDFAILTGYKGLTGFDQPLPPEAGQSSLRRTTPLHHAARCCKTNVSTTVAKLFQIYNRYDLNYVDEFGVTHFHVACKYGCEEIVPKFLESGLDPNCPGAQTGDTPLHLAAKYEHHSVVEMLVGSGANPNLTNRNGSTTLHVISKFPHYSDLADLFFTAIRERNQELLINAQDKFGETPLHLAVRTAREDVVLLLLKHGADPNLISKDGSNALHVVCKTEDDEEAIGMLLEECHERYQPVNVNVRDNLGRTPLQWAVASLLPDVVNTLITKGGADLSTFVFPTEDYFAERYTLECTLQAVVFPTMCIVDILEKTDYVMDQTAALTIMRTFAKYGLVDEVADIDERLRADEEFARIAKDQMISPDLSLYDFLRLPVDKAEKYITINNYVEFTSGISDLCDKTHQTYMLYLCETVARKFFRQWALKLFTSRGPWPSRDCCENIIADMRIKALWDLCMEAAEVDTRWLANVRTEYIKQYYNRSLSLIYGFRAHHKRE